MRTRLLRYLKHLSASVALLGATAGVLIGTTGILASTTGLPFAASTACGCGVEPLPNETKIEGFSTIVEEGKEVPVINWEHEAPITTKGCKGGKVVVSVEAENT